MQQRRRGRVEMWLCTTSSTLRTQQSQKCANNNILHTHHKTDGDVEGERESAWHWLKSASQSNYILILWKLQKCWPLGKSHGLQSHCIECVLLHSGAVTKGPSVCSSYFSCCCLWLMCPIFVDSIFLTKEELALPRGHRLFMYQIYFCCHGLPGFTSHLLGWWKKRGSGGGGVRMPHCGTWVLQWKISTVF